MRLTKIKLAGFKSFVDPTTIPIPSNLVGIVGPNGCGKSNTIDAVRWVMGESSAKHLRGDSMADVIFNGSNSRKPVGHASVELIFDNTDGKITGEYAHYNEISIKRQVSRDGTSKYFLNGTACRRRDITDIFLGTGLGPRSYSIIEQGMISRLIEAKPEDLRVFLEEAAGISKYKERRRETENRIRHTNENLDRLNDLREEIEKQIEKLQRQARTAERYKELKQQERKIKSELLALRYRDMHGDLEARDRALQEQETRLQGIIAEQRALESEIEKSRLAQVEANDAFNEVQGRYYGVGGEIARVEQSIQHAKENRQRLQEELDKANQAWNEVDAHIKVDTQRLSELRQSLAEQEPVLVERRERAAVSSRVLEEAESAMQQWQAEWEAFNRRAAEPQQTAQVERTRIDHLERQFGQLDQRLARIEEEKGRLDSSGLEAAIERLSAEEQQRQVTLDTRQSELEQLRERIRQLREESQQQSTRLDQGRSELQQLQGRLASLEALQKAALGKDDTARGEWLTGHGLEQAPRLAQQLQVEPGWETAVETVLGDYLEAVCVDDLTDLTAALDELGQAELALIDRQALPAATVSGERLSDKVQAGVALEALLGGVHTAADLPAALALRERLAAHESVMTPDGVWLGSNWLRISRVTDQRSGVIEREQIIADLQQQVTQRTAELAALQTELQHSRDALQQAEQQRDELQKQVNDAHRTLSDTRAQLGGRQSRLEQIHARIEAIGREAEELAGQQQRDQQEHDQARSRLHAALAQMDDLARERESRGAEREVLRERLDEARKLAQHDREEAHALNVQVESMRTARDSTAQNLERMQGQQGHLRQRREELAQSLAGSEQPLADAERELAELLQRRSGVEQELQEARQQLQAIEHRLREQEQNRHRREQEVQQAQEALTRDRMAWQEIKTRAQTLLEQLAETGQPLEEVLAALPEDANEQEWAQQAEDLERKIQRLGAINLAAIEEYEEESKRKAYLDEQHADLTEALETLRTAIHKIDRETRTRFKETFDKVNSGLQRMFPRLFGGGHAYLELTGEDLLDTGVAVMARPPGKRNSTIHLLSGGEKALTAVALVFAIFELNPSPFCMLDEVDAPLDDANVGRFCDMVREMSERVQFIFITHNKITMELSRQLTGVTMHEPGVSRLVAVDIDEAAKLAAM